MSIAREKCSSGGLSSISNYRISFIPNPSNLRINDDKSTLKSSGTTFSGILR